MELRPITDPEKVINEEIRRRAKNGSKTAVTKHFVAVEEGVEVAFVALDISPDPEHLVLYELLVPKARRCQGIGSQVLAEVEKLAKELKYAKVLLRPKPLDDSWSSERLDAWYSKRGYKPVSRNRRDVWTKEV